MHEPVTTRNRPASDSLNLQALRLADELANHARARRVGVRILHAGGRLIDCGAQERGGLIAGLELARICMAGLGDVRLVPGALGETVCPHVQVVTDHPVAACLASQYAGWSIQVDRFFAMGSGPMRTAAGKEAIFERIGYRERPDAVVGVLECRKEPTDEVVAYIAEACQVTRDQVTLLYAPTASLAGGLQVVARSVETALHKLSELGFDLNRVVSGLGTAPLPPVAANDLAAIGRTNDAILYGAQVVLYVTGDDDSLRQVGHRVPSSSSPDHGAPFAEIFERYHRDFYAVDPQLFSPAQVVFQNLDSGQTHTFGRIETDVLLRSFSR
jgi:methenyltetrahydromethanopterin cyclohydrolase